MDSAAGTINAEDIPQVFDDAVSEIDQISAVFDEAELMFELGLWLSGLESFLRSSDHGYANPLQGAAAVRNYSRELRLTRTALLLCSRLNFRLRRVSEGTPTDGSITRLSIEQINRFGILLRDAILLNEGLSASVATGFGEWTAWNKTLSATLQLSGEVKVFIAYAETIGDTYLPAAITDLLKNKPMSFDAAELAVILPRFARILKWLSVVGRMLRNDEPLKPTLLIFSRVHEQTTEMVGYIDRSLARFPDEGAELFSSLDGASYTAALELKKVYNQELIGIVGVRPAPSVYARIETAYSLLNDSFQQIISGFVRLADPKISTLDLFPNFRVKLEQSLLLREDLARVLRIVQRAEQDPGQGVLEELRSDLGGLLGNTMRYLFYKDRETIERFGEEIFAAGDKKDLTPILHRFGAYLETLFGQVNMRTVLADHPFEDVL